jgi:hypothetical protein
MVLTRGTSASSLITHQPCNSNELEKEFVNNPRIRSRNVMNLLSGSDEKWMELQMDEHNLCAHRTIDKADRTWSWAIMTSNTRIKIQWTRTAVSAQIVMPRCLIRHRHCLTLEKASAHYSEPSRTERSGNKINRIFRASEWNSIKS